MYSRAADEGTGGVQEIVGHDVMAGLLTLLLCGVRPNLVHDQVHVSGQVSMAENGAQVKACEHTSRKHHLNKKLTRTPQNIKINFKSYHIKQASKSC